MTNSVVCVAGDYCSSPKGPEGGRSISGKLGLILVQL